MIMCHMLADTVDELHAMADKIGLKREWYQPKSIPHYDVCQAKRRLAIKNGAHIIKNGKEYCVLISKIKYGKHTGGHDGKI